MHEDARHLLVNTTPELQKQMPVGYIAPKMHIIIRHRNLHQSRRPPRTMLQASRTLHATLQEV